MSDTQKLAQTQTDVAVIRAGQLETNRRLTNIESKMDGFSFVKLTDYEADKKTFMTHGDFAAYKWFFRIAGATIITTIVGAAVAWFIGGRIK